MRIWKRICAVVTAGLLCLMGTPSVQWALPEVALTASAEDAKIYIGASYGLQLEYEYLEDGTIEITKFVSATSNMIELPSTIEGVAVTSIGQSAFAKCELISVVIPSGVTKIQKFAFNECPYLESVTIPATVTFMDYAVFQSCTMLSDVTLPYGTTEIGSNFFFGCDSLKSIDIPDTVQVIEHQAFTGSGLTSINLPNSVTTIANAAFGDCDGLTSINIPASVENIDSGAFPWCDNLMEFTVDSDNQNYVSVDGVLFSKDMKTLVAYPPSSDAEEYTVPATVTSMHSYAFWGAKSLKIVNLPNVLTSISWDCFEGCTSLENITLPYGLRTISSGAFSNCYSLKSITIPKTVTLIDNCAFNDCLKLEEIYIENPDCQIDSVYSIDNGTYIYGYGNSTAQEYAETYGRIFINIENGEILTCDDESGVCGDNLSYTIEAGIVTISGTGDMYDYKSGFETDATAVYSPFCNKRILKVILENGVTSVGANAFSNATLNNVEFSNTVSKIGNYAFDECGALRNVNLNSGMQALGNGAFQCSGVTLINFGDTIVSIGEYCFNYCEALDDVVLPKSVEYISKDTFRCCASLKSITFENPSCGIGGYSETISNGNRGNSTGGQYDGAYYGLIYGYNDSLAQNYAEKYNYNFVSLGDVPDDPVVTTTITTTTTTTITTTKQATTTKLTTSATTLTAPKPTTTSTTTFTTAASSSATAVTTTTAATTTANRDNQFLEGADNWSFANIHANFGFGDYFIKDSYYEKLMEGLSNTEKEDIRGLLSQDWGGSCYGMAVTSLLACNNILIPSDWQHNANFLHDIDGPPSDDVESLINYYFAIQYTDEVYQHTAQSFELEEAEKLQDLLNCLEDDSPTLLTFFGYFDGWQWGGHAVVAYDVEYGAWVKNGTAYNGRVLIYDNNAVDFDENYCLYFNSSKMTWAIPEYSLSSNAGSILGLISDDINLINYHGYLDGAEETSYEDSYISILSSAAIASDYSLRKINFSNGKWNINTTADDDIKMFSSLTNNTENGDIKFALKDSTKGYVMQLDTPEAMDLSMRYENSLLNVNAASANQAVFDPSGYVEISGTDTDYTIHMVYNEGYYPTDWHTFEVSGNGVGKAVMKKTEDGYILTASNLEGVTASANNDRVSAKLTFSTDYTEVLLYEIDETTIGVAVDKDGNGTYETTIAQSETTDISLLYGDINLDGKVDLSDVVLLNKVIAGTVKLNDQAEKNADCNGDGARSADDSMVLLQFLVHLIDTLPTAG